MEYLNRTKTINLNGEKVKVVSDHINYLCDGKPEWDGSSNVREYDLRINGKVYGHVVFDLRVDDKPRFNGVTYANEKKMLEAIFSNIVNK